MKISITRVLALVVLALISVEAGGPGIVPCDKIIGYACGDKAKEIETKWAEKMTPECKAKYDGMKDEMNKKLDGICAGKAEEEKTCTALKELGKEKMEKMGKDCMPKMSCEQIVKFSCSDRANDKEMGEKIMSTMSEDCKKKFTVTSTEIGPKRKAACEGKADVEKTCETLKGLMKESHDKMGPDCQPKWGGGGKKD